MTISRFSRIVCAASLLLLAACTTTVEQRGSYLDVDKLKDIKVGTTTLPEVGNLLGSPAATNNFGPPTWYYISQVMESWAFMEPKIKKQNVVIINFDQTGVVQSVQQKDLQDAKKVDFVEHSTESAESQMTIMQQLLGNLGRFNDRPSTK